MPQLIDMIREEFPGLEVRVIIDRDRGELVLETRDDEGNDRVKRFQEVELFYFKEILGVLRKGLKKLTPRRRYDRSPLAPPS